MYSFYRLQSSETIKHHELGCQVTLRSGKAGFNMPIGLDGPEIVHMPCEVSRTCDRSVSRAKAAGDVTKKITQKFSADRLAVPRPFSSRETLSHKVDNPPQAFQPGEPIVLKLCSAEA
jgi:hypothetical protein